MNEPLYPINTVVAATDFSENGDLAVLRGAHIAQQAGKELHLLHVVHPLDLYPELMVSFDSEVRDYERLKQANGMESLDKLAVKIRTDFDIKVRTATRIGRPHTQIAEYARDQLANLLVVGFHGEHSMLDVMIGSTSFRLLKTAPCPVLIVRNKEVTPYNQAIAAVDLTPGSLNVSSLACTVAPHAQVEALHVFDLKYEVLRRDVGTSDTELKKYRDEALKHVDTELNNITSQLSQQRISSNVMDGYLPETICARVNELNADLVVLGSKGKSSLQEFVWGSVSKTVASMVSCDVLLT
jgi:nucleotide-binding universal stress UspA family protein